MNRKRHDIAVESIEHSLEQEAKELKREYKHFQKFRDENNLLFGVFVLGLAVIIVINTLFWVHINNRQNEVDRTLSTTIASLSTAKSAQNPRNSAVGAIVKDVGQLPEIDPMTPVKDDEAYLMMTLSITNRTDHTQRLVPVNQCYIRTVDGHYIAMQPNSNLKDPLVMQEVPAGKTVTGKIGFVIPKNIPRPLLYIDTQWDNTTPLVVDVLH